MTRRAPHLAKLTMPQAGAAVPRQRLFEELDRLRSRFPAIWIAAPGGAGKSVLVSSYLQARGLSCLWFQMDAADADPSSFFHYLGQGVAAAAPRFRKPMPLFTPEYQASGELFVRRYFEEMSRRLGEEFVIVLDNCEAVEAHAGLWPLLAHGVRSLPPGVTVIFTSRHEAPPAFASLSLNGKIGALGWEDMKVSSAEAELVGVRYGQGPAAARQLQERAGGWMAALIMMCEQARRGGGAAPATGESPKVLFDFFSHDIFTRMPQEMRALLLKTAFLPEVSVAAAERLSGDPGAGRILAELCHHNLFTERLFGSPAVYQYHPLFRDFLVQQCEALLSRSQLGELERASAAVLAESGRVGAAVHLLADATAFAEARDLLLAQAPAFINQGRNRGFLDLLALLPAELTDESPWCCYWQGVAMQPYGPAAARARFVRAFECFEAAGDLPGMLRCWSAVVETVFHEWDNFAQIDPWIAWLDEIIKETFVISDPALDLLVSSTMTAALTMRGGEAKSMRKWCERAMLALRAVEEIHPRLSALVYCTNYISWVQPLDLDTSVMETSLRDAEQAELPPILQLTTIYTRAALALQWAPDMKPVLEEVHTALALADETGVHVWDEILCGLGVYCATVLNDRSTSARLLEKMRECVSADRRQGLAFYYYVRAWSSLAFGAPADARELIAKALELYVQTGYEFPSNVAFYGAAIICAERGELDTALAYARQADATAERYEALAMRYTTLLSLAYVHLRRGETSEASRTLAEALRIGRKGGYYLTLWWWYAPMMSALATLALADDIERDHAIELVRRLKLEPADPAAAPEAWPWPIRIRTLGRFEVLVDGRPLEAGKKSAKKALALLKVLAAYGPDGLDAERLADLLWPELDGDKGYHALEMALHRLRKLLGRDDAVQMRGGRIRLDPARCRVDASTFAAEVEAGVQALAAGQIDVARAALERTLPSYRGHFLGGDADDAWTVPVHDRLSRSFLTATEALGMLYERSGETEKAAALYRRSVELDGGSNVLARRYIQCCRTLGRNAEADGAELRLARTR